PQPSRTPPPPPRVHILLSWRHCHSAAPTAARAGAAIAVAAFGGVAREGDITDRDIGAVGDKDRAAKTCAAAATIPSGGAAALRHGVLDADVCDGDGHRHLGRAGESADEKA